MSDEEKEEARQLYHRELQHYQEYEQAVKTREQPLEFRTALQKLTETVRDLERRGLLQYDDQTKRYDLHPIVRGIASGGLRQEEKEHYAQRVVDHFSRRAHNPYEEAETLEDVRDGLHVVRTLLQMGRYQQAYDVFIGDLASALHFNLNANAEILSLLRPLFPQGWAVLPKDLSEFERASIVNVVGDSLRVIGERKAAQAIFDTALLHFLPQERWEDVWFFLTNMALTLSSQNRHAKAEHVSLFTLHLAE